MRTLKQNRNYEYYYRLYWKALTLDHLEWAAKLHEMAHLAALVSSAGECTASSVDEASYEQEYVLRTDTTHSIVSTEDGTIEVTIWTPKNGFITALAG